MKYAVIKNGGHQYRVMEGQVIEVELLNAKDQSYVFEEVLLTVDGDKVEIGTPFVPGMKVYADVIGDVKGDKIEVFKYKSKSRYRKHTGHRQQYTQVKISGIGNKPKADIIPSAVEGSKSKSPVKPKTKAPKVVVKKRVVKKTPVKKPAAK